MEFRFLLDDVSISIVDSIPSVQQPILKSEILEISENEFSLYIEDLARFYSKNGNEVQIEIIGEPHRKGLELYLNGSVLGSILHQRQHIPIHGSSFNYKGKTVLVCGDSGAGKSTMVATFCSDGSSFLTDDITPIHQTENGFCVTPISDSIKLWDDAISHLQLEHKKQSLVAYHDFKYYVNFSHEGNETPKIDMVLLLGYGESDSIDINELSGSEKFHEMLNQIYRNEYMEGMPSLQSIYFNSLVEFCSATTIYRVKRSDTMNKSYFIDEIKTLISGE